jgi:hypothetical protein
MILFRKLLSPKIDKVVYFILLLCCGFFFFAKLKNLKVEINHPKSWMKCCLCLSVSMEMLDYNPH